MLPALILVVLLAAAAGPAWAQSTFPPSALTNLQVLPKDTRTGDLVGQMKDFTRALGVRCQFCHAGEEGLPLERFDFVSDVKPQKTTARSMMRMVQQINGTLDGAVPNRSKQARVTCWTCHAGKNVPPTPQ